MSKKKTESMEKKKEFNHNFKIGDAVKLKNDTGREMLVNAMQADQIITVWFLDDGRMATTQFNYQVLKGV